MARAIAVTVAIVVVAAFASELALAQVTPEGGTKAGAALKNPIAPSAASIAAGGATFQAKCAPCHGPKADGQGTALPPGGAKPADLTRSHYKFGTSDGDIFTNIKNGILPDLNMPTWDGQIADRDIWDLVNYLSSIRKKG